MKASVRSYKAGFAVAMVALLALVVMAAPGAQASGTYSGCPNKKVSFQIEDGEGGKIPYSTVVKSISVKNVSCAGAYEFLRQSYNGENIGKSGFPQNYKCTTGKFDTALGYLPETCSKGGKGIKYAVQGG
jgi:hypothetical protein